MPPFKRAALPAKKLLNVRVTPEEDALIADAAERLGLAGGKSALVLQALEFYFTNHPQARAVAAAFRAPAPGPAAASRKTSPH